MHIKAMMGMSRRAETKCKQNSKSAYKAILCKSGILAIVRLAVRPAPKMRVFSLSPAPGNYISFPVDDKTDAAALVLLACSVTN